MKLLVGLLTGSGHQTLGAFLVHLGHEVKVYKKTMSFLSDAVSQQFQVLFIQESFFKTLDEHQQVKLFLERSSARTRVFFLSDELSAFQIKHSGVVGAEDYNAIKRVVEEANFFLLKESSLEEEASSPDEEVIEIEEEIVDNRAEALELGLVKISKAQSIDEAGVFLVSALGKILKNRKAVFFKYLPTYCSLVALDGFGFLNKKFNGVGLNFSSSKEFRAYEHLSRLKNVPSFMNIIQKIFEHERVDIKILEVEGEVRGVLVYEKPPKGMNDLDLRIICDFTQSKLAEIHYKKLYSKNKTKDELTNCLLKDGFFDSLQNEVIRSRRVLLPLTVFVLEIDNFSSVKARYNKERVNILLKSFSKLLTGNVRHNDVVGRISEERFAIIFPHMSFEDAKFKAEKIKQLVQQTKFFSDLKEKLICSCSISIGTYPSHSSSADAMLFSLYRLLDHKEGVGSISFLKAPEGFKKDFEERSLADFEPSKDKK